MAVSAVVCPVIPLLDMLSEDQLAAFFKMRRLVMDIRTELLQLQGYLIDAQENQGRGTTEKDWADKYLVKLYQVEDTIETFAIRIVRQRERMRNTRIGSFFKNNAIVFFFFFNLKACQKLRWKMAGIGKEIKDLNTKKPNSLRDASLKYPAHQHNCFGHSSQAVEEEEEIGGRTILSILCGGTGKSCTSVQPRRPVRSFQRTLTKSFCFCTPGQRPRSKRIFHRTLTKGFCYEEEESGIIGFGKDVNDLVSRLTSEGNNILSIVGEVGSGKTRLAQAIYKSKAIKDYFEGRAWIFVSKDYSKGDLLLNCLNQVERSKDQGMLNNEQQMVSKLSRLLQQKKYLVVLDDVRTRDAWDSLKDAFPNTSNGRSKIIVTTRDKQVASSASDQRSPHSMQALSDNDTWKMFLKKARLSETLTDPSHDKILEICKGLPLWIVLLGGYLSTKSRNEWSKLLDDIDCNSLDILSFCYIELPVHTKLCLLYMVLFPKEFDIPVRRLVRLWLAEGFVERKPPMIPEDVAQEYFDDLVNRNVIQISKFSPDGSPKTCRLPGALHDDLLPKTKDIGLFYIHRNSSCNTEEARQFGLRRIVEYVEIKNCPLDLSVLQHLRSYISFNLQKKDIPAREVENFVLKMTGGSRGFALLRVLDLEGVYKPSLPNKLGCLFNLRYLGLRWTFLDYLPDSVCDLPYLETLDLKRTCINSLPNSIWKLKHLRHLDLNEIRLDMPKRPRRSGTLTSLLTLWGLFVDDKSLESLVKNGLDRFRDLRELGITFNLSSSSDLTKWISKSTNLQSLMLRSKDERGCPSKLDLKPLSRLVNLSHLELMGNLEKLPDAQHFPPGLKVLTLSVSRLTQDPMPTLGQLQNLTVLRLLANSYLGERIVCPSGRFGKLRALKLWMLKKLEDWVVEEGAMQNLKELDIRCCDSLTSLPQNVLLNLEELTLTNMPNGFVDEVRRQNSERTSLIVNKDWKFSPLPWEEDDRC